MSRPGVLHNPALWATVGVLAVSAVGFGYAIQSLGIMLKKLPIQAEHGVLTRDVSSRTASWERARGPGGEPIPDQTINAEIEETLGTKNHLTRTYVETHPANTSRPQYLQLHLAYYTGKVDTVPHVPDRCFVGGGMQIGKIEGDLPLLIGDAGWKIDGTLPADLRDYELAPLAPDASGEVRWVHLPRDARHLRLRTMRFLDAGRPVYAGYLFIANGGHTPSANEVRGLAFDLKNTYAYYLKVQVTSQTARDVDEFIATTSSLVSELLPEIMRTVPDWPRVRLGLYPPPTSQEAPNP